MGHEVVYCRGCGRKIGSARDAPADAVHTNLGSWCPNCSHAGVATLPADQQAIVISASLEKEKKLRESQALEQIKAAEEEKKQQQQVRTCRPAPPRKMRTRRGRSRHIPQKSNSGVVVALVIVAVIGLVVVLLLLA